jgi:hypothetical protein
MNSWRTVSLRSFLRVSMLVAFLALAAKVRSEDGALMRFPIVGKTRFPSGLQMEVDTRWVEAQGYRPIRIKLGTSPPLPAPADRTIRIELKTYSRLSSAEESADVTTAYVTLPQGKQSISTSFPVRQEALWSRVEIECYEGGFQLLDMSGSFNASASARRINQGYGWDQDAICFLVVNSQIPTRDKRTAGTTGATPTPVLKSNRHRLPIPLSPIRFLIFDRLHSKSPIPLPMSIIIAATVSLLSIWRMIPTTRSKIANSSIGWRLAAISK